MIVYIEKEFNRLQLDRAGWNKLAQQGCTNSIFQTYEWNRCWWDVFKNDSELFVVIAREGKDLVGLAPLMIVKGNESYGSKRVVKFIGTGQSDYCDFLVKDNCPRILSQIMDRLFQSGTQWDKMKLVEISEKSISGGAIQEACEKYGHQAFFIRHSVCPSLIISKDPQYARLVSNKESLRRRRKYFKNRGEYEVLHLFDPIEIEKYLDQFFEQHISRWEKSHTPSLFLEKDNRLFYEELVKRISVNKWLIFTVVRSRGVPIAFHFGFDYNNILTWYKPTFNSSFSKHSPGQVLLKELLDYAIDNRKDELDFTVGNEPFKRRFSNFFRENRSFCIYQRSIDYRIERARDLFKLIGSYARRGIKAIHVRDGVA